MDRVSLIISKWFLSCKKFFICCFLAAIPALLFQSCELEPNPAGNKVDALILNCDGFRIENKMINPVYACIGEFPYLLPDNNDICKFEDVVFPYNIEVGTKWMNDPFVFKDLFNPKPVLLAALNYYYDSKFNELRLNVNVPPIEPGKIGIARFISKELLDSAKDLRIQGIFSESDYSRILYFRIPGDKNSISGKLIFLEGCGTYDVFTGELMMESYEYYGSKDLTVNYGQVNEVTFTEEDIKTNPEERNVSFNVSPPPANYCSVVKVSLDFDGYYPASNILLSQFFNSAGLFEAALPVLPDIKSSIIASSFYDNQFYYKYLGPFESIKLEPGTISNIVHIKPELLFPFNGKSDVNIKDYFSVNNDGEKSIYIFEFYETAKPYGVCRVVTDKNIIKYSDVWYKSFKFKPNTAYGWFVIKMTSFESIDDFVSSPFIFSKNLHSVSISDKWYFKTAP